MMQKIAALVTAQTGWRACVLSMVAGALMTLTFAPFYYFPLLLPALLILFWQLEAAPNKKSAFWRGCAWGFGFFLSGTYWISFALLVDAEQFAWLVPFALFGLNGALALFFGLVGVLFGVARSENHTKNIFLFLTLFSAMEYVRGHIFTGFPWNLTGYATGFDVGLEQLASLVGVYGLGWLLIAWVMSLLLVRKRIYGVVWLAVLFAASWAMAQRPEPPVQPAGTTIRVVQPNIDQSKKWDPAYMAASMQRTIRLSSGPGLERIDLVVWPETAIPYTIHAESDWLGEVTEFLTEGQYLLAGAVRKEGDGYWNAMLLFDHTGRVVSHYDKRHLVPFGEYVPLSDFLPIERIVPGFGEFNVGTNVRTQQVKGLPALHGLICYEVLFPLYARVEENALLVNLTNDAWFGESTGPYQHEAMTRMRAIEQARPLLRAANTGISGFYDHRGRAQIRTGLNKTTSFDVELFLPSASESLYRHWGDIPYLIMLFISVLVWCLLPYKVNKAV